MSRFTTALVFGRTAMIAGAVLLGSTTLAGTAAASGKTSTAGDFAVTVNGTVYNPPTGKDFKASNVSVSGLVTVRGRNVGFDIDPGTLGVYRYTLTGAPDPSRMVTKPTVIYASKVPTLTAAQRAGVRIQDLEIRDDTLTVRFQVAGGTFKVQAKDAPQGGIFQMEPEFAGPVELVHTLAPGIFYFVNPFTGKINLGSGIDPVTKAQDPVNYHQMLLGKDSPQVATKTFQDGTVTRWSVASGGRMGGVLGEDAIELSAGASSCTSKCQAQERIRGSLPVPPLPVNPTPIGG